MTKSAFLEAYAIQLTKLYDWARNEEKLARFLRGCIATIREGRSEWNHDGPAVVAAWRSIGGKGTPTLKALRALA